MTGAAKLRAAYFKGCGKFKHLDTTGYLVRQTVRHAVPQPGIKNHKTRFKPQIAQRKNGCRLYFAARDNCCLRQVILKCSIC